MVLVMAKKIEGGVLGENEELQGGSASEMQYLLKTEEAFKEVSKN